MLKLTTNFKDWGEVLLSESKLVLHHLYGGKEVLVLLLGDSLLVLNVLPQVQNNLIDLHISNVKC